jgi:anaerobic magnesium-protoporphyrin IX monomethyl ester cyclase
LEMMFHGTYTSDFYRSIRDLLHDQISLQTAASGSDELRRAANALDPRWQELLNDELKYRSSNERSAASA